MTPTTATTYALDTNCRLHRSNGQFSGSDEIAAWAAVLMQAIIVYGCKLGQSWAELDACDTFAVKASSPATTTMTNPETGEDELVPVGVISAYSPRLASSWVGFITWESSDLYPEIGTITVCNKLGNPVYRREGQTTKVLLSILRADKVAKSTGVRSIGATVHHYFGRKASKTGVAASYDPFLRPAVVNGQLINVNL